MHPPGQVPWPTPKCVGPEQAQDGFCRGCTRWLPEDAKGTVELNEGKHSSPEMNATQVTG